MASHISQQHARLPLENLSRMPCLVFTKSVSDTDQSDQAMTQGGGSLQGDGFIGFAKMGAPFTMTKFDQCGTTIDKHGG